MESLPISETGIGHRNAIYCYSPLPPGETFRYLILEPGGDQNVLQCSLRTATIADADYEAISYVWGTEVRNYEIDCDGRKLKITKNLYDALTRFRADSARNLWADSICIDQQNMDEKTHQLACMGRIYAGARRVLVYMGPDLDERASRVSSLLSHMRSLFDSEIAKFDTLPPDLIEYPSLDDPVLYDERWSSLEALFQLPWFRRGWVVRETGLAKACEVAWGSSNFSWTDIMRVVCWICGRSITIELLPSSWHRLQSHLDAYWDRHEETARVFFKAGPWQPSRLLDYLASGRFLQFRDRRDCIFAFLDLATTEGPRLELEYDQAPHLAFLDFAVQYLQSTGDITILEYIDHRSQLTCSDLPSWVPNWDAIETGTDRVNLLGRYFQSPLLPREGGFREPRVIDRTLLKVHGAIFATVEDLSDPLEPCTTTPAVIYNLWCWMHESRTLRAHSKYFLAYVFLTIITQNHRVEALEEFFSCRDAYVDALLSPSFQDGVFHWTGNREHLKKLQKYHRWIQSALNGRKFMITTNGIIGLAPPAACMGDVCAIIFGCIYPCLLRATPLGTSHQYVGPAAVEYARELDAERDEEWPEPEQWKDPDRTVRAIWHSLAQSRDVERVDWGVTEQDIYLS